MTNQTDRVWYVTLRGNRQGPFNPARIAEWLQAGRLSPKDLCWREGMSQWTAIEAVPELAKAAGPAAPVSTGPPPPPGAKKAGPARQPPPPPPKVHKKQSALLLWGLGMLVIALLLCAAAVIYLMQAPSVEIPDTPPATPPNPNMAGQIFALNDYVPVNTENEWVYQVTGGSEPGKETRKYTSYKTAPDGGIVWTEVDGGQVSSGFRSEAGEKVERMGKRSFTPPVHLLKDPMTVGDRLRTRVHVQRLQAGEERVFTSVVDAVVDAATPAGTFENCVQVSCYVATPEEGDGLGQLAWRAWYARDVGMVKKSIYEGSTSVKEDRSLVSALVNGRTMP